MRAGVVGVAAAVLALGARRTAMTGGVPTTPAGCRVRRGLEPAAGAVVLGDALIEVAQHGIELIKGHRRDAGMAPV